MLEWIATHLRLKPKPHKTAEGQRALALNRHGITLVLDVGANVGQTGLKLRKAGYSGRIVSFEPVKSAHAALQAAAAGDDRWEIADPIALGAAPASLDINVSAATDLSSFRGSTTALKTALPNVAVHERQTVRVERLDSVFDRYAKPDDRVFLKIDTQGFEAEVLTGASGILPRIHGLQLELSLFPLYDGEKTIADMLPHIREMGFEPWLMLPVTFSRPLSRQLQVDAIFFRSEPAR